MPLSGPVRVRALLLAVCCLVLPAVSCGWLRGPASAVFGPEPAPTAVRLPYVPPPSATPWPTFTPVPTPTPRPVSTRAVVFFPTSTPVPLAPLPPVPAATPTPVPEPSPSPSPSPLPTRGPVPPGAVEISSGVVQDFPPGPEPSPTPYGQIPGEEVYFVEQSLFPMQRTQMPEFLETGDHTQWPRPVRVVSRDTRYVMWALAFDTGRVPPDFELEGFVRWTDVSPGYEPLIMLESPRRVTRAERVVYAGLGRGTPGFWKPGRYRVEFLDDEFESVVSWDFEVR